MQEEETCQQVLTCTLAVAAARCHPARPCLRERQQAQQRQHVAAHVSNRPVHHEADADVRLSVVDRGVNSHSRPAVAGESAAVPGVAK